MFYKDENLAIFIDGPNFYSTARALEFDVDYKSLLAEFQQRGRLLRASYFTPLADTDDHVAIKPLVDWMQYNGWHPPSPTPSCSPATATSHRWSASFRSAEPALPWCPASAPNPR